MEFLAKLHPFVVHFAISFVITGVLLDIFGLLLRRKSLENAGFWLIFLSIFAVWIAYFTGHQAEEIAEETLKITQGKSILEQHEKFGNILPYFVSFLAIIRVIHHFKLMNILAFLYIVLGTISTGLILYTGRLGGILVYEYGAGVKLNISNQDKFHNED
ncbi:MAG: DUF2231 domain-containing protein [candidate division WOR-3 bacterium]